MSFKRISLGECITLCIDHRGKTPKKLGGDWSESGYRAFSAKNIKTGAIVQSDAIRYVDERMYEKWMIDEIERGDILVTSEAPFGQVYIWDSDEKIVLSQRLFGVRPNRDICDPHYLYYWMCGQQFQGDMRGRATGTTVIGLRQPALLSCEVLLPDMGAQKRIAFLLRCIDSKIVANKQANDYLAEMCEVLAAAVEPDGDGVLSDITVQAAEKIACTESSLDSYVSTESLLPDKGGRQKASSLPTAGKVTVYRAGDTLVSNIRPYFKKIWLADRNGTCSGDVIVFRAKEPRQAAYLYSVLRSDAFFEHVMAGTKGTKMPRGDKKQMMQYPVARACDQGTLDALTIMVEQMGANSRENETLSGLRDALLPKLMSGEIDVSQIDLPTQPNNHLGFLCASRLQDDGGVRRGAIVPFSSYCRAARVICGGCNPNI